MCQIKYDENKRALRWVGYIDLLGSKNLISVKEGKEVFAVYRKAIEEFKAQNGKMADINSIWSSDTFILYSDDNSLNGYSQLEHLSHWFLYYLIKEGIPVRGAISYGEFYCDKKTTFFSVKL